MSWVMVTLPYRQACQSIALTAAMALPLQAQAYTGCTTDAMLVFDGSASMSEISFDVADATRIEDSRRAIARIMPQVEDFRRIGLITYGPGGNDSCTGIAAHFAPRDRAALAVTAKVQALVPAGLTPLSAAVEEAARMLDYRRAPGVVVLVTDGNETCGGRPCTLGAALARDGADLTVHVIGFKVVSDFFTWNNPEAKEVAQGETVARCLADQTGGRFVDTDTVDELVEALRSTLGCPVIGQESGRRAGDQPS
ncbi:MAG: VWA domain-containing protein [Pseudomonadota bacterium]